MALIAVLNQAELYWFGYGAVALGYTLPIKPNAGITGYNPSGRGYSDVLNASIDTFKPAGRRINDFPSGGIQNIIPNAY